MARDPVELSDEQLAEILRQLGIDLPLHRDVLWAWFLSRVERVRLADGTNVIVKLARPPFEQEARILLALGELGLPVPVVLRAGHCGPRGELVMVLEDLGLPIREATLAEGAEAARLLHGVSAPAWLPVLGEGQLTELPARSLAHLAILVESGRWSDCDELARLLHAAQTVAERRVEGVRRAPFGPCHSEYHPTSLHVGKSGWRLLDWARAFRGPGLIDLASWQGTQVPARPTSLDSYPNDQAPPASHPFVTKL
jgi:hypothetical protein